ncbi:PLP-dependent aminotransferase family protein [Roseibium litorale]|uniref:PLP-dependent aminotransferase family protein n=1 Tax=Roseibium litorale TaxID=2803841 RepID=A0ABR9CKR0_9HYPH|nr:PLP-dependent aminotransferase family protein [Roseibium litorale]MBD8891442.1 PLP-dependent aminotransferase family protein [Roseibium litorale]
MTIWCPDISTASGPIYLAVADALEADIRSGALAIGTKLPPQRELAYQLGVTLGTITRAYREAERRRLLRGETGRGTFVAPAEIEASPLIPREDRAGELDLARNFAFPHLNPDLAKGLARLSRTPGIERLNGFVPSEGLAHHREAGARLFQLFRLSADPSDIAVTCGAQHGIQVLLQALFRQGDAVAVDTFTYPSLLNSAPHLGLKLVPVPMRRGVDGRFLAMDPEALGRVARTEGVRGVFLMPNMHNPTTHTMTLAEREELVQVARLHGLKIIEDDPYTPFVREELPAIGELAPELTASIASISKLLSPGSRIGFVHVPREYGHAVRNLIGESTWMASPITAELVSGWIADGTLKRVLQEKRRANEARFEMTRELLGGGRFEGGPDKVFGWLHLDPETDPGAVEAELRRRGVASLSSRYFQASDRRPAPFMRLCLGSIAGGIEFRTAVTRVAEVLADPRPQARDLPGPVA